MRKHKVKTYLTDEHIELNAALLQDCICSTSLLLLKGARSVADIEEGAHLTACCILANVLSCERQDCQ